jgi:hypothetical protein
VVRALFKKTRIHNAKKNIGILARLEEIIFDDLFEIVLRYIGFEFVLFNDVELMLSCNAYSAREQPRVFLELA